VLQLFTQFLEGKAWWKNERFAAGWRIEHSGKATGPGWRRE
jgi:hypothetical protein